MIYTLTLNPALDYTLRLPALEVGETNRSLSENLRLGGKGINVSAVLKNLGGETVAFAFAAGAIGELMKEKAREIDLPVRWLKAQGESRINLKIKAEEETEINARGVVIEESALEKLKTELSLLQAGDFLVLAGSLPAGMRRTLYAECIEWVKDGVNCVVDTTGESLKATLAKRPFLVKPNAAELGELFGVEIENKAQAAKYAKELLSNKNKRVRMEESIKAFAMPNSIELIVDNALSLLK